MSDQLPDLPPFTGQREMVRFHTLPSFEFEPLCSEGFTMCWECEREVLDEDWLKHMIWHCIIDRWVAASLARAKEAKPWNILP